jgi:Flp pilus assembly protein TadG
MAEFGLMLPLLLIVLVGAVEAGFLFFGVGTARYAAGEGGRVAAEKGNAADADSQAIQSIRSTALGQTTMVQVQEVDVYRMIQDAQGRLNRDTTGCAGQPCLNRYDLSGTLLNPVSPGTSAPWPSVTRDVSASSGDFLGITVKYQYAWKSGSLLATPPLQLEATSYVRMEPQTH